MKECPICKYALFYTRNGILECPNGCNIDSSLNQVWYSGGVDE